jgi:hypothetical protein
MEDRDGLCSRPHAFCVCRHDAKTKQNDAKETQKKKEVRNEKQSEKRNIANN